MVLEKLDPETKVWDDQPNLLVGLNLALDIVVKTLGKKSKTALSPQRNTGQGRHAPLVNLIHPARYM